MSAKCPACNGSGERGQGGYLDCSCAAATDRAALEAHLQAHQKEFGRLHERDMGWEAYKLGQAKNAEDAARYRWLRHMVWDDSCFISEGHMKHGAELDAAVDAARAPTNNSTESTNPDSAKN